MIFYYKNSFLASLVSIFASGLAMMGILALLDKEILMGIVFLVISIPLFLLGKQISVRKSFKKWWKNLDESGVIAQAAASREVAIAVYQKNPTKQTLNAIRKINPAAAAAIENKPQSAQPQTISKPAPQKPVTPQTPSPAPSQNTPETELQQVIEICNRNTQKDPQIYLQCATRLETLYAKNPQYPKLKENLAQVHLNYAATIRDFSFDSRKKAVQSALRALEVDPDASPDKLDQRVFWLFLHIVMASIDAGNNQGTRQQMQEAREMLRMTSKYYIRQPDEKGNRLMGIALPVARCRIAYKLALNLSSQAPIQRSQACAMAQEALRFCPADTMRQCDLNPYTEDNTTVILTRQQIQELCTQLAQ